MAVREKRALGLNPAPLLDLISTQYFAIQLGLFSATADL